MTLEELATALKEEGLTTDSYAELLETFISDSSEADFLKLIHILQRLDE